MAHGAPRLGPFPLLVSRLLDRIRDLIIHGPAHRRGANSAAIPTAEDGH